MYQKTRDILAATAHTLTDTMWGDRYKFYVVHLADGTYDITNYEGELSGYGWQDDEDPMHNQWNVDALAAAFGIEWAEFVKVD